MSNIKDHPFSPIGSTTVALTVGPAATTAPVALPTQANVSEISSVRVRNANGSASPVAFVLTTTNAAAVYPTAYTAAGISGVPGDMVVDPNSSTVFSLTSSQIRGLLTGALKLSAITPAAGSATLFVTLGSGF